MNLGFKQYFDLKKQEPTNFREKILAGVTEVWADPKYHNFKVNNISLFHPKIHTIRLDPHNRWKPGMSIQMVYRGPGYSILDHFNKGIPELEKCVSVQKIEIKVFPGHPDGGSFYEVRIDDGPELDRNSVELIAKNDGFNSIFDFQKWFKKDFTGRLIHWTDLRY